MLIIIQCYFSHLYTLHLFIEQINWSPMACYLWLCLLAVWKGPGPRCFHSPCFCSLLHTPFFTTHTCQTETVGESPLGITHIILLRTSRREEETEASQAAAKTGKDACTTDGARGKGGIISKEETSHFGLQGSRNSANKSIYTCCENVMKLVSFHFILNRSFSWNFIIWYRARI